MEYYPQFHKKNISPEWRELVDDYPDIFLDPSDEVLDMYHRYSENGYDFPTELEDVCNLRYGFECNIGWLCVIRKFCEEITTMSEQARERGHVVFYKSFIMKEKFGTLRDQGDLLGKDRALYLDEYNDISGRLEKSTHCICEDCGKPATQSSNCGWIRTLCSSCILKKELAK